MKAFCQLHVVHLESRYYQMMLALICKAPKQSLQSQGVLRRARSFGCKKASSVAQHPLWWRGRVLSHMESVWSTITPIREKDESGTLVHVDVPRTGRQSPAALHQVLSQEPSTPGSKTSREPNVRYFCECVGNYSIIC
jgi:hypothetical protein